jgi:hypothetical protein
VLCLPDNPGNAGYADLAAGATGAGLGALYGLLENCRQCFRGDYTALRDA